MTQDYDPIDLPVTSSETLESVEDTVSVIERRRARERSGHRLYKLFLLILVAAVVITFIELYNAGYLTLERASGQRHSPITALIMTIFAIWGLGHSRARRVESAKLFKALKKATGWRIAFHKSVLNGNWSKFLGAGYHFESILVMKRRYIEIRDGSLQKQFGSDSGVKCYVTKIMLPPLKHFSADTVILSESRPERNFLSKLQEPKGAERHLIDDRYDTFSRLAPRDNPIFTPHFTERLHQLDTEYKELRLRFTRHETLIMMRHHLPYVISHQVGPRLTKSIRIIQRDSAKLINDLGFAHEKGGYKLIILPYSAPAEEGERSGEGCDTSEKEEQAQSA